MRWQKAALFARDRVFRIFDSAGEWARGDARVAGVSGVGRRDVQV